MHTYIDTCRHSMTCSMQEWNRFLLLLLRNKIHSRRITCPIFHPTSVVQLCASCLVIRLALQSAGHGGERSREAEIEVQLALGLGGPDNSFNAAYG